MSIFTKMADVIQEELIAGRIDIHEAKAQLAANASIAVGLELLAREKLLPIAHTKTDWQRDKELDESMYTR